MSIIKKVKNIVLSDKSPENPVLLDEFNQSLLHIFSNSNDFVKIEKIVLSGIDLDLQDKRGKTALHYCAINNNYKAVCLLLEHNARTDLFDILGNSALWDAVLSYQGDIRIIEQLLLCSSDMHVTNRNMMTVLDVVEKLDDKKLSKLFKRFIF